MSEPSHWTATSSGSAVLGDASAQDGSLSPPVTRLLVLDDDPWYGQEDAACASFLKHHLGFLYTDVLDQGAIDALLAERLFPDLRRLGEVDLVVVPLMAGAVLVRAAIQEFTDRSDVPVIPMPISRHPGVCFLREPEAVRRRSLRTYGDYARTFLAGLGELGLRRFANKQELRLLILDQTHHAGHVVLVVEEMIRTALASWHLDFVVGVLINEIGVLPWMSPGGAEKATRPDAWALEADIDTRSTSHLYYVLGHLRGAWAPADLEVGNPDILTLWQRDDPLHKDVHALFPTPRLYRHEDGVLNSEGRESEMAGLWEAWTSLPVAPRSQAERSALLGFNEIPSRSGQPTRPTTVATGRAPSIHR